MNDVQTESVDAATIDYWSLMAAMPYLALKEPCGTEFFKFLRGNDPELDVFKRESEATRALTENFYDIGGERRVGSALLLATGRFARPPQSNRVVKQSEGSHHPAVLKLFTVQQGSFHTD